VAAAGALRAPSRSTACARVSARRLSVACQQIVMRVLRRCAEALPNLVEFFRDGHQSRVLQTIAWGRCSEWHGSARVRDELSIA
jgi:hypothetical protein